MIAYNRMGINTERARKTPPIIAPSSPGKGAYQYFILPLLLHKIVFCNKRYACLNCGLINFPIMPYSITHSYLSNGNKQKLSQRKDLIFKIPCG